ncbi:hypothetical protein BCR34DRAFT_55106 [Clohesyomyces aquaticus]|uniref:Rhodopsin domain-containing protein n=1 Tax=Clohesyomyces aquaticus TaxID=1231657 RepID=A0A1Y1Z2M6_9PLEO|nr:hypothetical protein BCR34DRAFT_55106 [Clohesyomyces aquaticus]
MPGSLIPITTEPQRLAFGVQVTFAIIATAAVGLRLFARRIKRTPLQWDDYLIIVALTFTLGLIACDMIGTLYCGVGLHMPEVARIYGPDRLVVFLKLLIPIQIFWATSLAATKCSILAFYHRIFSVLRVDLAAKVLGLIILLYWITVMLCTFLLCRPFAFNWDQSVPNGVCGNRVLSYIMTGVLNILTDLCVLCLPMPVIWGLQMKTGKKIGFIILFATGFFVCAVSIVRLRSLLVLDYTDITYSVPSALIWSMLEPSIAVTLACVPIIYGLVPGDILRLTNGSSKRSDSKRSGSILSPARQAVVPENFQAADEVPLEPGTNSGKDMGSYPQSAQSAPSAHEDDPRSDRYSLDSVGFGGQHRGPNDIRISAEWPLDSR